jgi:hypothetical protein
VTIFGPQRDADSRQRERVESFEDHRRLDRDLHSHLYETLREDC